MILNFVGKRKDFLRSHSFGVRDASYYDAKDSP